MTPRSRSPRAVAWALLAALALPPSAWAAPAAERTTLRAPQPETTQQKGGLEELLHSRVEALLHTPGNTVPVVTPLIGRDGQLIVDRESVRRYFRYLHDTMKVGAVLLVGKTGEWDALGPDLRAQAIRVLTEEARQINGWTVFTHVTGADKDETLRNAQLAASAGADALVLAPTAFLRDAEIEPFVRELRQAHPALPILLYNNHTLGRPLDSALVGRLWAERLVAGLKDSSGDREQFRAYLATGIPMSQGDERSLHEALAAGRALGVVVRTVGSSGNFWPLINETAAMSNPAERQAAQRVITETLPVITAEGRIPAAAKYLLSKISVDGVPLMTLTVAASRTLALTLEQKARLDQVTLPGLAGAEEPGRILLADDSAVFRNALRKQIAEWRPDLEIVEAETGQKALRALRTAKTKGRPFNAVILDGWVATVEEINPPGRTETVPILVVSYDPKPAWYDPRVKTGQLVGYGSKIGPYDKRIKSFLETYIPLPTAGAEETPPRAQRKTVSLVNVFDLLLTSTRPLSSQAVAQTLHINPIAANKALSLLKKLFVVAVAGRGPTSQFQLTGPARAAAREIRWRLAQSPWKGSINSLTAAARSPGILEFTLQRSLDKLVATRLLATLEAGAPSAADALQARYAYVLSQLEARSGLHRVRHALESLQAQGLLEQEPAARAEAIDQYQDLVRPERRILRLAFSVPEEADVRGRFVQEVQPNRVVVFGPSLTQGDDILSVQLTSLLRVLQEAGVNDRIIVLPDGSPDAMQTVTQLKEVVTRVKARGPDIIVTTYSSYSYSSGEVNDLVMLKFRKLLQEANVTVQKGFFGQQLEIMIHDVLLSLGVPPRVASPGAVQQFIETTVGLEQAA